MHNKKSLIYTGLLGGIVGLATGLLCAVVSIRLGWGVWAASASIAGFLSAGGVAGFFMGRTLLTIPDDILATDTPTPENRVFIAEQWVDQPSPLEKIDQTSEKQYFSSDIATVVYDSLLDTPFSDTHDREKALTTARQALLTMDHTKAVLH